MGHGRGHVLDRFSDGRRVRVDGLGLFERRSLLAGERRRCGQRRVHGRERVGRGAQSGAWHLERACKKDFSCSGTHGIRHARWQDGDGARTCVATRSAVQGLLVKRDLQIGVERVQVDFELIFIVKVPVSGRRGHRAGRVDSLD